MWTEELKLKEINLFLDLVKTSSVRELARQRSLQPGQVSKGIRSLEQKLGVTLVERSAQGIRLTPIGTDLVPYLENMQRLQESLAGALSTEKEAPTLTFASTSYFSTHFLPTVFSKFGGEKFKLRLVDLPPAQFVPVGLRGAFQVCVHSQDLDWPKTWTSIQVGELHWNLYARKDHPLLEKPTLREVTRYPFVFPIYWTQEGYRYGNDQCPLPISKRIRGVETTTATAACEIVSQTEQLGFLPELVMRQSVKRGEAVAVPISSWKPVTQPVYLTVKNDQLKQHTFERIQALCRAHLDQ